MVMESSIEDGETLLIDREDLEERIQKATEIEGIVTRLMKWRSANDVFSDFSVEAARAVVFEMYTAKGRDKLKAAEMVLDRALGKPVDRQVNMSIEASSFSDEELEDGIQKLLEELGYEGRKRGSLSILVEGEREGGDGEASKIQAEPRISGEISGEPEKDSISDGGESIGEDSSGEC